MDLARNQSNKVVIINRHKILWYHLSRLFSPQSGTRQNSIKSQNFVINCAYNWKLRNSLRKDGPFIGWPNKYNIKSINSRDSTKARHPHFLQNVDWSGETHNSRAFKVTRQKDPKRHPIKRPTTRGHRTINQTIHWNGEVIFELETWLTIAICSLQIRTLIHQGITNPLTNLEGCQFLSR